MDTAEIERVVALARAEYAVRLQREEAARRRECSPRAMLSRMLGRCRAALRRWLIPTGSRRSYLWVSLRRKAAANPVQVAARPLPQDLEADRASYLRWIALNEPVSVPVRGEVVSVCCAGDGVEPRHLAAFLESVRRQTHSRWECCVAVGDHSPLLDWYASQDARIRVIRGDTLREALDAASGEFVTFADAADEMAPDALAALLDAQQRHGAHLVYADEDRLDGAGRFGPLFKHAWCPEAVPCHNYVGRPALLPRAQAKRLAGTAGDFEHGLWRGLADESVTVVHLPRVLYHRRGRSAVEPRRACAPRGRPLVSVVIPNKDSVPLLRACIDGVRRATYRPLEILVVENNSSEPATFAYYEELAAQPDCRVLKWDGPFNFAAINNEAARQARGDVLLLLNNDVEPTRLDWIEHMLELALQPGVGAVGAQLLYPDGTVQHAGLVVGIDDQCGHWQRFTPGDAPGYGDSLRRVRPWCAVTAACLMLRRDLFRQLGGFDEAFAVAFNDIDLCLRLHARGLAVLCTPEARLIHHESQTRGLDSLWRNRARLRREVALFRRRWAELLRAGDPFFSPNLSLLDEAVRLELRGRVVPRERVRRTQGVPEAAREEAA